MRSHVQYAMLLAFSAYAINTFTMKEKLTWEETLKNTTQGFRRYIQKTIDDMRPAAAPATAPAAADEGATTPTTAPTSRPATAATPAAGDDFQDITPEEVRANEAASKRALNAALRAGVDEFDELDERDLFEADLEQLRTKSQATEKKWMDDEMKRHEGVKADFTKLISYGNTSNNEYYRKRLEIEELQHDSNIEKFRATFKATLRSNLDKLRTKYESINNKWLESRTNIMQKKTMPYILATYKSEKRRNDEITLATKKYLRDVEAYQAALNKVYEQCHWILTFDFEAKRFTIEYIKEARAASAAAAAPVDNYKDAGA